MPRPKRTREELLAYLIQQQERDAKRDRLRRQEPEPDDVHPDHAERDDEVGQHLDEQAAA
jgi:hypothetical protein